MTSVAGELPDQGEVLAQELHALGEVMSDLNALVGQTSSYLAQLEVEITATVTDSAAATMSFENNIAAMMGDTQAALEATKQVFDQGADELQNETAGVATATASTAAAIETAHSTAGAAEQAAGKHLADLNALLAQFAQTLAQIGAGIDATQQQVVASVQSGTAVVGECHESWTKVAAGILQIVDDGLKATQNHMDVAYGRRLDETLRQFQTVATHVEDHVVRENFQQLHDHLGRTIIAPTHEVVYGGGQRLAQEIEARRQAFEQSCRRHSAAQDDLRSAFDEMKPVIEHVSESTHSVQHVWDSVRNSRSYH